MKYHWIQKENQKIRLDKFLTKKFSNLENNAHNKAISRAELQRLIRQGMVTINGILKNKPDFIINTNDDISLELIEKPVIRCLNEEMKLPFSIIFEDDDILVINKNAGLVVHPGAGNIGATLSDILINIYNDLSAVDGFYPGIVHRLDKGTTGLMLIAKNNHAHYSLAQQLQNRTMSRIYNALVFGIPNLDSGTIKTNIKRCSKNKIKMAVSRNNDTGKEAITHYKILERFQEINLSLLELRLETGRTHQIRVHLSHNKNPIVGDKLYINSYNHNFNKIDDELSLKIKHFSRQALHAKSLYFIHPTNKKQLHFESELAADIKDMINQVILLTY